MRSRTLLALLVAASMFLAGCFGSDDETPDPPPGDNGSDGGDGDSVTISGSAFRPETLEVAPGTTVIWTNEDGFEHTATADDESWDAGTFAPGQSDGHTFSDEGDYPYHCAIHPSMKGTITVVR